MLNPSCSLFSCSCNHFPFLNSDWLGVHVTLSTLCFFSTILRWHPVMTFFICYYHCHGMFNRFHLGISNSLCECLCGGRWSHLLCTCCSDKTQHVILCCRWWLHNWAAPLNPLSVLCCHIVRTLEDACCSSLWESSLSPFSAWLVGA